MNTFGNYKGDMFGDLEYQISGGRRDDNEKDFQDYVSEQHAKGCTCHWQLANGWEIQNRGSDKWNPCPIHD